MAPESRQEPEGLRVEIARLRERVRELVQERDYLRILAGTLAQGQQRALEARPRRRWRWPWQRGGDREEKGRTRVERPWWQFWR